ncbi:dihydrofolate reductase family protein [Carnobacterium gallinarum]|uniref:dihydrofolate reductase family protein n=1 Tax=Carnobacterium gallinarum TaxID=2749 RepID=UPI000550ED3F|nr:RibD family protein [Carnobacterium gallinarum]
MTRPFVFCHMLTSLDGKIMGNYMSTPEGKKASEFFYDLAFTDTGYYQHQGWLSGRRTSEDNFTQHRKLKLAEPSQPVPAGDFMAEHQADKYYVSIDGSGHLGWVENTITYKNTTAHIIEVLTNKVSEAYKAHLRQLGISYIVVGETEINMSETLTRLKEKFSIETLMLGGGGVLNWSLLQQGLCDELSVVMAPVADGSTDTQTLFEVKEALTEDHPIAFDLLNVEANEEGAVWYRYAVKTEPFRRD